MLYENLSCQKEDHVMIINLPKIAKYHARITQLANELSDICTVITLDKEVQVVIMNWEKEDPSSGIDLGEDVLNNGEFGTEPPSLAASVAKLDIPVITALNGYAIGQALELALACDIRIASKTSHFGLSHIDAGMIPWDGGTQRLSRLVGGAKALELILTGEIINAQEALRIGLVNRVAKPEELSGVVMEVAWEMAAKAPISLRFAKEAIHKGMDLPLEQGLRLEADLYFLLHTTRDRTEGIKSFQEKRKGQFEGR